jgi:hypothetical protein
MLRGGVNFTSYSTSIHKHGTKEKKCRSLGITVLEVKVVVVDEVFSVVVVMIVVVVV